MILFDGDVGAIRQLELYKLMTPGSNLRIYFATYQNSIEEQKFLSSIKKEQDAFDKLIREKAVSRGGFDTSSCSKCQIRRRAWSFPRTKTASQKNRKICWNQSTAEREENL